MLDDEANKDEEVTYTAGDDDPVGGVTLAPGAIATTSSFRPLTIQDTTDETFDDDYSDWSAPANGRTKSVVPDVPTDLERYAER